MKLLKIAAGLVIIIALGATAHAFSLFGGGPEGEVNTIGTDGVAIKGYDPVAYFTEGGPHKGKPEYTTEYKGAKWQFSSAKNKELFEANPEKYAPAYGGYCAYGVAQDALVKIEPDAWSIHKGKLYLNYDQSVRKSWSENPDGYIEQADQKWPALTAKQ
ncbi:MAG TPA: YHS domain-containing (seleno)protein [Hyphomicrobiales bacterium]|nr:YHS domain-containing (seleno)protein [Hyphomicrobiales bacterium]